MIWVTIIILITIELFSWIKYRDLLCPAVLANVMWIISIIFASNICPKEYLNSFMFIFIIIGAIIFQIGFSFANRMSIKGQKKIIKYDIFIKKKNLKILIIFVFLGLIPTLVQYFQYMRSVNIPFYEIMTTAEENLRLPAIFNYYRKIIQFLCLIILNMYWNLDKKNRKSIKKYVLILFIMALLCVVSVPTRNGILFFILPLVFTYLSTHKVSNKKILLTGMAAIFIFLGIFYNISLGKYWYLYENSNSRVDVIINELITYLSGSIVAFIETANNHSFTYFGQNTFRFFFAIIDKIFHMNLAQNLVNEFTTINYGIKTNVYTFYDFYLRDFGLIYAIFVQFIMSIIHGVTYKGVQKKSPFQIYLFSMLSYPLIMQFFQDQYISLMSTWLQVFILGLVLFKTKLLFVIKPVYDIKDD